MDQGVLLVCAKNRLKPVCVCMAESNLCAQVSLICVRE